jgi:hypothetical protein
LHKIEGLSVGPRTFATILLFGLFLSTSIGVTSLKSGLAMSKNVGAEADLPDTIEFLFAVMRAVPLFKDWAVQTENRLIEDASAIEAQVQIVLGIVFIIAGLILVLLTLPRRHYLRIRVSHGKDFKLHAGVKRKFWEACYREIYKTEIVQAPKEYRRGKFPWLEGEKVVEVADLDQTIYSNRIIGIFAIIAGTLRVWTIGSSGETLTSQDFYLWLLVALSDIYIAFLGVRFSKRRNELLITTKRIIFVNEMKSISGAFGRRLYFVSDLRREGIAGFEFKKKNAFSIIYLAMVILILNISFTLFVDTHLFITPILLLLIGIVFSAFINQTFIEFSLLTLGGEKWLMRHQLANPMTRIRRAVGGEENLLLTTLFSNRLEEPEVINVVQQIRSEDLKMPMKGRKKKTRTVGNEIVTEDDIEPVEEPIKQDFSKISLADILLEGEEVNWRVNIPRRIPRRKLSLAFASFVFLVWCIPAMALFSEKEVGAEKFQTYENETIVALPGFYTMIVIIGIITLWIKFYSITRASLIITSKRVFYEETRSPSRILWLFGVFRENIIKETLRNQIHSTYTRRQVTERQAWVEFLKKSLWWFIWLISFSISTALILYVNKENPEIAGIYDLYIFLILICLVAGFNMAWNAANATVELIRAWPRRTFNATGIGAHYAIPYVKADKAAEAAYVIWSGELPKGSKENQ